MAKQLYDYWFVQFDFPNEEGKPYKSSGGTMVWNENLKREIPQGWSDSDVISLIEPIERGVSYSSDEILDTSAMPMINLACFSKAGDYRLGEMKYFSGVISKNKLISPMDMLIACTDMTQGADIIGRPILASNEHEQYTFSTDLAAKSPKAWRPAVCLIGFFSILLFCALMLIMNSAITTIVIIFFILCHHFKLALRNASILSQGIIPFPPPSYRSQ